MSFVYCNILHAKICTQYHTNIYLHYHLQSCIIALGGEEMDKMYSIKEVAKALSVSEITIRRWIAAERINVMKMGGTIRISETEIIRIQKGE